MLHFVEAPLEERDSTSSDRNEPSLGRLAQARRERCHRFDVLTCAREIA